MKFKPKLSIKEAFKWQHDEGNKSINNFNELKQFCSEATLNESFDVILPGNVKSPKKGDYIVRGFYNEFYIVNSSDFDGSWEEVKEDKK